MDGVKNVRRYDASHRQEQAAQNRSRILDAARQLFLDSGYAAAAMPEIARAAGVSVQTVYKVFSNKATLLKAVFDVSVAGDDEAEPMAERDSIQGVVAEPDAARKIDRYARLLAADAHRFVPVQLVARDAATADGAAAQVWAQIRQETLGAMTMFAADLQATGRVRADLTADEVRDLLWTFHSPEIYEMLVLERGWTAERYGWFLAEAMSAAVLRRDG